MCMSDSSRDYDSNGSHKSFKDILQSKQGFDADSLKRGIKNTLQSMFSPKSDSSVYSKGVRELDNYGYEKYNIEDDGEIFISKVPEKALFNDGEPIMVRATGGNFVGSADNTSARIDVGEAQAKAEDVRSLFSNVPRGTTVETEYHATVGEVTDEGTVKPRPIDRTFLDRMRASAVNERAAPHVEFEADDVSEEVAAESPRFLQIDDEADAPAVEVPDVVAPVEEPVIEATEEEPELFQAMDEETTAAPAEEPEAPVQQYSFLDRVASSQRKPAEFFVDDVDEPVTEEVQAEDEEDDEYSWIKFDDEVEDVQIDDEVEIPMIATDVVEAVAEAPVEQFEDEVQAVAVEETPAEEPVIAFAEVPSFEVPEEPIAEETPIEAPVEEAKAEEEIEIPMVAADILEETVVEAPVEETLAEEPIIDAPIIAEAPVEVPEEPFAEETPIEAVAEAPVEPVAVMTLPGITDVEPIAGLEMEGSEPSSESAVSEGIAAVAEVETAVTGADVEPAPAATSRFNGLEEDGEGLPKLSDPVIKRPRSVRFRFSNGVLQNVESNDKVEPKEELRGPLA